MITPIVNGTIYPYIEYPVGYYLFVFTPDVFVVILFVIFIIYILKKLRKTKPNAKPDTTTEEQT